MYTYVYVHVCMGMYIIIYQDEVRAVAALNRMTGPLMGGESGRDLIQVYMYTHTHAHTHAHTHV